MHIRKILCPYLHILSDCHFLPELHHLLFLTLQAIQDTGPPMEREREREREREIDI